jgi:uncharacterized protein (TIGR03435 family)
MRQAALMSFAAAVAAIWFLSAGVAGAQQAQPAKALQFEVATIRPGDPKLGGYSSTKGVDIPGGQVKIVNMPLRQWVEIGLSVSDSALKAPPWLDTSRFDLDARLPAGERASPEMMKALLIERFGLKWHEESQTVAGYELVPDKKVLMQPLGLLERMKESPGTSSGPTLIGGTDQPISQLAEALAKVLGRPVVDATHLSGVFDYRLMWRPDDDAAAAQLKQGGIDVDNLPGSVFAAVQEKLGLRLESAKVTAKVTVVDQISRQPTGN